MTLKLFPTRNSVVPLAVAVVGDDVGTTGVVVVVAPVVLTKMLVVLFCGVEADAVVLAIDEDEAVVVVDCLTRIPGAPYQPTNSGPRSDKPLLNNLNPPSVFSYGI